MSIGTLTEKVLLDTVSAVSGGKILTLAVAKLAAGTFEMLVEEVEDGIASSHSRLLPRGA